MATSNQSVTADQLISATVKYSNKDDASRVYDITANVNIQNGTVNMFDSGMVRKVVTDTENPEQPMGTLEVAGFSSYSESSLNLNIFNATADEAKLIIVAVYDFMADVKSNVNSNPITA